jgi:hypothetical protein
MDLSKIFLMKPFLEGGFLEFGKSLATAIPAVLAVTS